MNLGQRGDSVRVVAPRTGQGTPFEENRCTNTRTIVYRVAFYVEIDALHGVRVSVFSPLAQVLFEICCLLAPKEQKDAKLDKRTVL